MAPPPEQILPSLQLREVWEELTAAAASPAICHAIWEEISEVHQALGRYYHSLEHLSDIYKNLLLARHLIADFESVLYAMFFHDFVYDPQRRDNEEESARTAVEKMKQLNLPDKLMDQTQTHILATRADSLIQLEDSGYFVDSDLAVLGSPAETYLAYADNVRREYQRFPDFLYNPGRRNVLRHFLQKEHIYHSTFFRKRYETQARENLTAELERLEG